MISRYLRVMHNRPSSCVRWRRVLVALLASLVATEAVNTYAGEDCGGGVLPWVGGDRHTPERSPYVIR
uniref:Putative secreted protein n=1 Tax=Anopheles triannulatus TaxID=58253 RepID=A0A2M4B5B9_9DIPT